MDYFLIGKIIMGLLEAGKKNNDLDKEHSSKHSNYNRQVISYKEAICLAPAKLHSCFFKPKKKDNKNTPVKRIYAVERLGQLDCQHTDRDRHRLHAARGSPSLLVRGGVNREEREY